METILAAIIGGLCLVLVAQIPILWSTRKAARAAKDQLVNSHSTNMREEQDERHVENVGRLGVLEHRVAEGFEAMSHAVGKIERHLGIEDTIPPKYGRHL